MCGATHDHQHASNMEGKKESGTWEYGLEMSSNRLLESDYL